MQWKLLKLNRPRWNVVGKDIAEAKGFLSKYNDGDYRNDEANFKKTFGANVEYYIKNYSDCS